MYFVVICFFFLLSNFVFISQIFRSQYKGCDRKLLQREYYNLNSSGSYFGPSKLHESLKAREINIGTYKISKWLINQDDNSLHKPARCPVKRAKVVVSGIDNQWDLADMSSLSKFNKSIKFLLVVIDIFSRFVWVQSSKNKNGKEVVKGFKQILHKGRKFKKLRTDKGSEFTNRLLQQYLKYTFSQLKIQTPRRIIQSVLYRL